MKNLLILICVTFFALNSFAQEKQEFEFGNIFLTIPFASYSYSQNLQGQTNNYHSFVSSQLYDVFGLQIMLGKKLGFVFNTSLNYITATRPAFNDYFKDFSPENPSYTGIVTDYETLSNHLGLSYMYLNKGVLSFEIKTGYTFFRNSWIKNYSARSGNYRNMEFGDDFFYRATLHVYNLSTNVQGLKNSFEITHSLNIDFNSMRFSFIGGFGFLNGGVVDYKIVENSSFNEFQKSGSNKVPIQSTLITGISIKRLFTFKRTKNPNTYK